MILTGDCLAVMPTLEAESVDAVVTDPPYGLEFMGKAWDSLGGAPPPGYVETPRMVEHKGLGGYRQRPNYFIAGQRAQTWHERWATEAFRLAKPSAYLLAFGGTRTVHRMTCAIEDAGWIVRDMLVWAYASGFPKSKASLKPAWEPIVMARKPGPLRELAIDSCRIGTEKDVPASVSDTRHNYGAFAGRPDGTGGMDASLGRWPANLVLTDPIFDGGWDGVVGGRETTTGDVRPYQRANRESYSGAMPEVSTFDRDGDSGTYSRFFLIPKSARAEREPIWEAAQGLDRQFSPTMGNGIGGREHDPALTKAYRYTTHPTIKPLELMRHLVRLVTPTGGLLIDPFLGSGTTAIAAEMEGFRWIGIEREPEYVAQAEARLHGTQRGLGLPA